MDHINCCATDLDGGGEIRNIKLLGIPHQGDLLSHLEAENGGTFDNYTIERVEHLSPGPNGKPQIHIHVRRTPSK